MLCVGCSKTDPILPGDRHPVFYSDEIIVANKSLQLTANHQPPTTDCPYTQDNSNAIWDGEKKIFSGFATDSFVDVKKSPACAAGFVYAGLTTGEVVKVNVKTREVAWVADVYADSNMLGGASQIDIVAKVVVDNNFVYAAGLGNEFCKLKSATGAKVWCVAIGSSLPFIIANNAAFIVSLDGYLYGIETNRGEIYWRAAVKKQAAPDMKDGVITVGKEKFDAASGAVK